MIFYRWTLNRAVTLDLDSWDGNLGDWKGIGVDFYSYAYLFIARRRKREEKTRIFKDALLNDRYYNRRMYLERLDSSEGNPY